MVDVGAMVAITEDVAVKDPVVSTYTAAVFFGRRETEEE